MAKQPVNSYLKKKKNPIQRLLWFLDKKQLLWKKKKTYKNVFQYNKYF